MHSRVSRFKFLSSIWKVENAPGTGRKKSSIGHLEDFLVTIAEASHDTEVDNLR